MGPQGLVDLAVRTTDPLDREHVARWLTSLDSKTLEEIEELRIARRQLDDAALAPLATPLLATGGQRCFPRLRFLDLSGNSLTDRGSVLLAECAAAMRRRPNGGLMTLLLTGNDIGPEGAEALAMSFFPPCTSSSSSSEYTLSLSENPIGDGGVVAVATAVRIRGCRAALQLRDVGCADEGCSMLAESLQHLSRLDLGRNPLEEPAVEILAAALRPPLQQLRLSHLARCPLTPTSPACQALTESLARCGAPLQTLELAGDSLQDAGLAVLAEALAAPSAPLLQELDLAFNGLGDGNLLANLLAAGGRGLVSLGLEGNELGDVALVAFSAGLSLSQGLRRLNLARNRFGDSGAVALAQALQHQCAGASRRAEGLPLQPPAVREWLQLLGVLGSQPRLAAVDQLGVQILDLSQNMVTDEAAQALAEVPCLLQLGLSGTCIGGQGSEALLGAIRASHVRVERAVSEVYSALGAGTGATPTRLPWPLSIQGLGLEQLEADFAARAKAWVDIPLTQSSRGRGHAVPTPAPAPDPAPAQTAPVPGQGQAQDGSPVHTCTSQGQVRESQAPGQPLDVSEGRGAGAAPLVASAEELITAAAHKSLPTDTGVITCGAGAKAKKQPEDGVTKPTNRTDAVLERARKALEKVGSNKRIQQAEPAAVVSVPIPPSPRPAAAADVPKAGQGAEAAAEATAVETPRPPPAAPADRQATPATPATPAAPSAPANELLSRAGAVVDRARSALQRAQRLDMQDPPSLDTSRETADTNRDEVETLDMSKSRDASRDPNGGLRTVMEEAAQAESPGPAHPQQAGESGIMVPAGTSDTTVHGSVSPGAKIAEQQGTLAGVDGAQVFAPALACPPPAVAVPVPVEALPAGPPPSHVMVDSRQLAAGGDLSQMRWALVPATSGKGTAPPPPAGRGGLPAPKGKPPMPKVPKGPPKAASKAQAKAGGGGDQQHGEDANSKAPFHRKLYWKQLDLTDAEGTIFAEADNTQPGSSRSSLKLDTDALARMFEGEKEKSAKLARRSTGLLNRAQLKSVGMKLITDHRARNMAIVLKRVPVTTKELTRILRGLTWESTTVNTDDLEQLMEVIPTKEEAEKLRDYRSPEAQILLRDVEQMILPLALLSRAGPRVRLLCIARSARTQYFATARSLASIRSACNAVQRSSTLREVMKLALDLGNYINYGDSSKGAKAIAVSSLNTLKDFKTGKMSSLHFLCASLLRSNPDGNIAEALAKELRPAVQLSKLQVQTLQASVRAFQRDLETITSECKDYLHEYEDSPEGEEWQMEELEEYDTTAPNEDFNEEDATRWVEDVMKIRGSARRRLQCMRRVVEKLSKQTRDDMEKTAEQAHAALRFCGVASPKKKEVPTEFEALLQQLAEFIRIFRQHWDEVKEDMPSYLQLFGDTGGKSSQT